MMPLLMFVALMAAIFMGFPVAFSLMATALAFGLLRFGEVAVFQFVSKVDDVANANVLAAVPLFVFMGAMFERSGIADRLFEAIHIWTRRVPGGLAVASVLLCVIFAAASGIIGATESVVGLLAIPIMLRYAYDRALISGTICAGGSLGTIIPPSVVVIILGPVANVSVGDLFVGMLIPGLLLAALYIAYIILRCVVRPHDGPRLPAAVEAPPLLQRMAFTARALVPPAVLIVAVLGSIMLGIATPTEAAGVGALGAMLLTLLYGRFGLPLLKETLLRTVQVTAMILTILLGGSMFAGVFVASGGISATRQLLAAADLGPAGTLAFVLALGFLAGFVLEPLSIILIMIPVVMPIIQSMGHDPVWFCILFLVVLQTSYLTPPMAPSIFYLRGIAPPEITLHDMYRGVVPFIAIQALTLGLVVAFPALALWLPAQLLGFR
ncbi:MAG TPA: TRAP transporter large permease subunit [Geminicoccaceae bacterium]|nr:TRAP transporter large permease subunit [Geminicoccaceae bacterium]